MRERKFVLFFGAYQSFHPAFSQPNRMREGAKNRGIERGAERKKRGKKNKQGVKGLGGKCYCE